MSIDFSEYVSCLKTDPEHPHKQALESSYQDASRVMSPQGLNHYLTGMKAMCTMNKGEDLILTYVQEMPGVAREVGEDIIPDIVSGLMKLSSHTSGTVITLIMANMPLAASRLGDAEVLRGYLNLLHLLAGKSPRGLRPMMENMDELLSKLTLGGPAALGPLGRPGPCPRPGWADGLLRAQERVVQGRTPEGAPRHPVRRQPAQAQLLPAGPLGARLLHAPHLRGLRDPPGDQALHRKLPDPPAGRLRRLPRHLRAGDLPRRGGPQRRPPGLHHQAHQRRTARPGPDEAHRAVRGRPDRRAGDPGLPRAAQALAPVLHRPHDPGRRGARAAPHDGPDAAHGPGPAGPGLPRRTAPGQ